MSGRVVTARYIRQPTRRWYCGSWSLSSRSSCGWDFEAIVGKGTEATLHWDRFYSASRSAMYRCDDSQSFREARSLIITMLRNLAQGPRSTM